jgi:hypothetical protein
MGLLPGGGQMALEPREVLILDAIRPSKSQEIQLLRAAEGSLHEFLAAGGGPEREGDGDLLSGQLDGVERIAGQRRLRR